MQSNPKVIEKGEKSQIPICENIEQQPRSLSSQVEDLESFSQANTNTQWKVSEPSRVTSTVMPQYMVIISSSIGCSKSRKSKFTVEFVSGKQYIHVSNSTLIGQDMWKQLKRVSVPTFTGDKKIYQHWKAAFLACVYQAPATAEYKLLQLKQCLAGEELISIEGIGHSAAAYQAKRERLKRKFGGQH